MGPRSQVETPEFETEEARIDDAVGWYAGQRQVFEQLAEKVAGLLEEVLEAEGLAYTAYPPA